ncbi:5-methyltetrahydrofolate--homocysteine methyltransferase [Propionibacterium cyclohexanicum]|uniref:Methionine synthase n=1 Tax=Propionibacterium cyclohexanicum TaxID=64702 RepID=A0A1H9Q0Y5_9ACTN|nr:methionine synthase [Propionibacterium cyclohexanicum]SER54094.1 5-methyltetrahydrofolate--homocysteine methyltransferase [Propionibacterium cyclohexanicum]
MQNSRLRTRLGHELLIGDGAMGTMLQNHSLDVEDFGGLEGCNEILNVTRPAIVSAIHREYLAAGADWIETNTFGANHTALAEYGIAERLDELAEAGARIARTAADEAPGERFVLGSVGPGTKLATLGQIDFTTLREAYQRQIAAMIRGGIDAVQIETCQDLLQAKAAVIAAKRARTAAGIDLPIIVSVTVETTGTMLVGSEIGAALNALEPLGIDVIGLNCATGPAEMGEHLRYLAGHAGVALMAMPNAGLPEITAEGAVYPLGPDEFAADLLDFAQRYGLSSLAGCCGTTPEHIARLREAVGEHRQVRPRAPERVHAVSSLYSEVPLRQETSYLTVGERTNANGSKAFREAMLEGRLDDCTDIARAQSREGAHLIDLCVDYVGRDGTADMAALAARFATAVTLPIMLDSTEPEVIRAGLEHLPGRCIINSVNFEDGEAAGSRFARVMPIVVEHGAAVVALTIDEQGQARTAEWKLRVAERLIETLTGQWGMAESDILVDCLTFPIATGQDETRRDGLETLDAIRELKRRHPLVGTTLGLSNISFGLNPAARVVLNSVFLHEAVEAGLDSAIVRAAKIMPIDRIPAEQSEVALDLVHDRRRPGYDPLARLLDLFEGVTAAGLRASRAAELAALPLGERLQRRIIDGETKGLEADLDEALESRGALDIINTDLLTGMKVVGELFGSGQMQLPFVLQSAQTMKLAVNHLEPHMDASDEAGKGTLVLATVKGDVHDIGKNLVDIIVSNNGYRVVNLGIKQPISTIASAAEENHADAIGMSGLLVKSTMVMKDNLAELDRLGLASKYPVILGGAALNRAFVEQDLQEQFSGQVRYARDAFEGLALMEAVMALKRGEPGASLPAPRTRTVPRHPAGPAPEPDDRTRSDVTRPVPHGVQVPKPPFWGTTVSTGIPLGEIACWLDERALFVGQWGLKATRGGESPEELLEREGRPRLRGWLDRIRAEGWAIPGVVHGYFPCFSRGNELVVLDPRRPDDLDERVAVLRFPRQRAGRRLCIADFFRDRAEAEQWGPDTLALQLVTMGGRFSEATGRLFAANAYRDYLELHGLSVQLAEALAEMWHARVRTELGLAGQDGDLGAMLRDQAYRGSRYSFGYGACPDLEQRQQIVALLRPERIGVELSEGFQLHPEQSTEALVVPHPEAKYFNAR